MQRHDELLDRGRADVKNTDSAEQKGYERSFAWL
jgi:hypothetical protein